MSSATVPALTLDNGVAMPALGLGVFQTPPEETRAAVTAALDAGYRHIDTAAYGNEREVGEAVAASGLARDEVFLETKVVFFEPGENHWHGAAPNRFMVHIAMQQNDDTGSPVTWGVHVSDDEYLAATADDH
jgi:diketogulonate reductase-like aldo/keto reductase